MTERVLITGGAGFIGTRLAQRLLAAGRKVRVLDALIPQVHGMSPFVPEWLRLNCELVVADVRNRDQLEHAVRDVDAVVHLAAETGTAQSMNEIHHHVDVNVGGTAILLECLKPHTGRIRKLVVASSRAIYGEGKYECVTCGVVYPDSRSGEALAAQRWELLCPRCGGPIASVATDEDSPPRPASTYGVTKVAQEQLAGVFGRGFGVPVATLRFQNVYGAGQALGNPYTGILTHLYSRVRNGVPPRVFEDGRESRDFVHATDAVDATMLAMNSAAQGVFNVGSGVRTTILELAERVCAVVSPSIQPEVVGEFRVGDIRHCVADIGRAAAGLGYRPQVRLDDGMREFVAWAAEQAPAPEGTG